MHKPTAALLLWSTVSAACHLATGATDYVVEDGDGGTGGGITAAGTSSGGGTSTPTGGGAPTGTSAGTPSGSMGCDEHRGCAADQACFFGSCEYAYNRQWRFTIVDGEAPTEDPRTGAAWDPGGGAPDPYVVMRQGTTEIGRTTDDANTFYPSWEHAIVVVLAAEDENISFDMKDKDTALDPADDMTLVDGSPVEWLQAAKDSEPNPYSWNDSGIILNILIEPVQ